MEEHRLRVSCLGPEDSYSHCAARRMCEGAEIILCHNFQETIRLLSEGETDYAVLPVENSLNGGVLECLDLLEEKDVFAVREFPFPVDHRLAMLEGVRAEDIDCICSHEQALHQCSDYLTAHFPDASLENTASTAESLGRLGPHTAGIVGAHIHREGVILSEENIANHKGNFTRFILVERKNKLPERSVMVFFCAVCPDKPGSLVGLLKIFLHYSLNLTRIESRPVKDEFGQYRFFIEFVGDIGSDRVKKALKEAKAYCLQYKLLGAYS